ncbi:MAG: protein translocase subunit SecD [Bacteroidaceae bacterium]|nr:protein translocase subunit SecD [Bacteroidaceae bacterium]
MQNKGFVKVFAVLLTLVCLFYLSFSFVTNSHNKKVEKWAEEQTASWVSECEANGDAVTEAEKNEYLGFKKEEYLDANKEKKVWLGIYTLQQCRELEIGLGLDLKGGLSVTLEVSVPEFLKSLTSGSMDKDVEAAIVAAQKASEANGDAIGAFIASLPADRTLASIFASSALKNKVSQNSTNADIEAVLRAELSNAVENSFNVVRSRVDRFGVAQPNIQKLGGGQGRILVELPGVENKARVIELLTRSSNLQFWETYTDQEIAKVLPKLMQLGDEVAKSKGQTVNPLTNLVGNAGGCVVAYVNREGKAKIDEVLAAGKAMELDAVNPRAILPRELILCWGADSKDGVYTLYAIKDKDADGVAPLQGDVIAEATASFQNNKPCVNMTMNGAVAHTWANLTEECAKSHRPIAVVLDGLVYSAPVPEGRIAGGHSVISGSFTIEETQDLATVLCSGKMLVPMRDVESNVVGPSIGAASIQQGLISFVIAFILLMVYMCAVYGLVPGMIANGALLLNLFFTLGILASFQAALTMSGIAGIVLTLGMAVDANVLIYERAKEELRAGKNVRMALSDGYKNAFSAIFDSNLTSIITGIILFNFGTGPIKGFATTLIIGLLCSFFTAVFVTRVVYERFLNKNKLTNLTFTTKLSSKWLKDTKYNFIASAKKVGIVFTVLAVAMIASFTLRGMAKSIDFTGGRNYVVKFEQKVSDSEIRNMLTSEIKDANVQVISYGTTGDQVRISTNYLVNDLSADSDVKVETAIYNALKKGGVLADDVTFERFCDTQDDKGGSIKSSQKVGASIADDIREGAVLSVVLALIAIFIYILVRFRNVAYSVGSIFALAIDVLMIMGCYSLLHGLLPMSLELDQTFIGAILTAIGYSINDKVVIFDRIREFAGLYPKRNKVELFNTSLNTTLARTLNTSFSTLVVLLCIFIFGGDSIRSFSFAMILGVVFGTLSSIFIAAPIACAMVSRPAKKSNK